ncbi:hypothetical protein D3C87_361260 [compost metagenome]
MGVSKNREIKEENAKASPWSYLEKVAFRVSFVFFFLLIIPLQGEWYTKLFASDSLYDVLSAIAGGSRFGLIQVATESGKWGFASYVSWGLALLISLLGGAIWTILSRNSKRDNYNALYYWLRLFVRYRIAIGLIAFGFIKFFPIQMPFPSVANLNTEIGDYAPFKLYWQIVGASYKYQIFLGFLEIGAGTLLFFRSTVALGAIINAGVLFNIAHANLAYDGAVHVYSSYFVLLALFLLLQYLPNIWAVFINGKTVKPNYYYPKTDTSLKKYAHYGAKYAFIFFFLLVYGVYRYDRFYNEGRLKDPVIPGLVGAAGHYDVSSFVLNGDTLQYSPQDSLRWHDAAFERYSTFGYKVNKPFSINIGNGGTASADLFKVYELTGRAGGRTYYYYEIDAAENKLYLIDKNQEFTIEQKKKFDKNNDLGLKALYKTPEGKALNILVWNYTRPTKDQVVITGVDLNKNTIAVALNRQKEHYLIGDEWYLENNIYHYK